MEFYSHSDKQLLKNHHVDVKKLAVSRIDIDNIEFNKAVEIATITHDFGKYTTYFQDKLMGKRDHGKKSNHSLVSSIFAFFIADSLLKNISMSMLVMNVVKFHHTSIKDLNHLLPAKNDLSYFAPGGTGYILKEQFENIVKNKQLIILEYKKLGYEKETKNFFEINVEEYIYELSKRVRKFIRNEDSSEEKNFYLHQLMFSLLISSDKISASHTKIPGKVYYKYEELLENKRRMFADSKNKRMLMRNIIFDEVIKRVVKNEDKKIMTLNAPTGAGKTYTGFFAAQFIKEKYKLNKIIYSLPFTSIVDQNFDEISKLFGSIKDFDENKSRYILKHHYLGNIEYTCADELYNYDKGKLLIEDWNSEIIITTFVQLFQSIIGVQNKLLKKIYSLQNSVVILDEIQTIDVKYYKLISEVIKEISKRYNVYFIVMTATMPYLFSKDESHDLIINPQVYFKNLERTNIHYTNTKESINEFTERFIKSYDENKSYLIIVNTIKSSIEIFNRLVEFDDIYYLSTNITPYDRRIVLKKIKEELKQNASLILISTQVVEAGVDLDFDIVFRDIAPFDSIIQAAGRCNRNFRNKIGYVEIVDLIDKNNKSYSQSVYGILEPTREILIENRWITDKDYPILSKKYFKKIQSFISSDASNGILKSISNLNFTEEIYPINSFSLIEKSGYHDVIIVKNEIREKYKKLISILNQENIDNYDELRRLKQEIGEFTISLPRYLINRIEVFSTLRNDIVVVDNDDINTYYNEITGFIRDDRYEMREY